MTSPKRGSSKTHPASGHTLHFFPWWLSLYFSGGQQSVDFFGAGHWPSEKKDMVLRSALGFRDSSFPRKGHQRGPSPILQSVPQLRRHTPKAEMDTHTHTNKNMPPFQYESKRLSPGALFQSFALKRWHGVSATQCGRLGVLRYPCVFARICYRRCPESSKEYFLAATTNMESSWELFWFPCWWLGPGNSGREPFLGTTAKGEPTKQKGAELCRCKTGLTPRVNRLNKSQQTGFSSSHRSHHCALGRIC